MQARSFDPDTVKLLRKALVEAWASLSEHRRREVPQSLLAERILNAAAMGEREPGRLRESALTGIAP